MASELEILTGKLLERIDAQQRAIDALRRLVEEQREEIARLKQNSSNSGKPPSSDAPGTPLRETQPTGRQRGAQRGHKHHKRELLPAGRVTRTVELTPRCCRRCKHRLSGSDGTPVRVQTIELPVAAPEVTEFRLHQLRCGGCGTMTRAKLPQGTQTFGPRLRSTFALMTGRFRLSKREARQLAAEVFGVEISLGSVSNLERQVSESLDEAVEEARAYVRKQPVVHPDETGWRENKRKSWLWTAVTEQVSVFRISPSRGASVAREMLGEGFSGFVVSDRWGGYNWLTLRQLCWSHLKRDFQGFVDRSGKGARIGEALLHLVRKMFEWWSRVREGDLLHRTFQRRMKPVESGIVRLLRKAVVCAEQVTAGKAREILVLRDFLFTFVDNEEVAPTNNAAERAIRPAVLWRKGSFGTDSERGSRFVERMLTVVATLKQQKRGLLDFLLRAARHAAPSLLPG